jgi:TrmH family RNA methyltransferase
MAERRRAAPDIGDAFVIVLNEPQDIVNIAGTLRAMMNMGLRQLRLVRPALFDAKRIGGIAHGSEPLIERVEFYDSLGDAVADAARVIGTTSRRRTSEFVWDTPRAAAPGLIELALREPGPVPMVFGREEWGLRNEDLDLCDRLLVVPTDPAFSSLNLAQAVLLVAYELRMAAAEPGALPRPKRRSKSADSRDMLALFEDSRRALETIEFFKKRNAPIVMRTLRAVLRRAEPTAREAGLLRAMAIEVRKFFDRKLGSRGGREA